MTTVASVPDASEQNPDRRSTVLSSILDVVGETPLIRLNKVPKQLGLECEVLAKCEFLNPGGSVKDRIGRRMLLEAEKSGKIKQGDTLVEPTSGNTGVGLSMAAAAKGYNMVICMPEKMSQEKQSTLQALGATVIRTPTAVPSEHPDSLISVAWRLARENPATHHVLDQYRNCNNPDAHFHGTGSEILRQCGDKAPDMVVLGAGTGGTMTGVAKRIKQANPACKIIAVDPLGSILADPSKPAAKVSYQVEGIGYDFVPDVCDRSLVDEWYQCEDTETFKLAKMIQNQEGMLVGGSSGSAMAAVAKHAKGLGADKRVVVIFPDNIRNYLTKFVDSNWMKYKGLEEGEITKPPYDMLKEQNEALKKRVAELEAAQQK